MMNSVRPLALVCLLVLPLSATAADDHPTQQDSRWVTSVARIGTSDQWIASQPSGLLLRESVVMSFSANDLTKLSPLYTHPAAAWCVDTTSDGSTVASVDYRGNLVVYDVKTKKPTTHDKVFERWCQSMTISADNKYVVAGNESGKILLWDLAASKVAKSVEVGATAVTGLAISPGAQQLAASDSSGHVHLLTFPGLEATGKIKVSSDTLWCVAYTNDGKHLLSGSADQHLYRCPAKADAKCESVVKGKDWITRIAISDTGQVAASEVSGAVHFPSLGGSDSMQAKSGVWALCWNGDEQLIAGTRKDGLVAASRSWKWSEPKQSTEKPVDAEPKSESHPEPPPAKKPEQELAEKNPEPDAQAETKTAAPASTPAPEADSQ